MNHLFTIVASTVVAGLVGTSLPAWAQPSRPRMPGSERASRVVRVAHGAIEGVVLDERGTPVPGVTVSALGSSSASAVTDRRGSFILGALPVGSYLVRAERPGFAPSSRRFVQVAPNGPTRYAVTLQRTGSEQAIGVLAAGVGGASDPLVLDPVPPEGEGSTGDEDHSETAWRLRHLKRSILKEAERAAIEGTNPAPVTLNPGTYSFLAQAMGGTGQFLADLPLSGTVKFLTSGSFDSGPAALSSTGLPMRELAFFSVGGPAWRHGDWSAQFMAQDDLGAWFVGGAYHKRSPASHLYDVGVTYSAQRFDANSGWPITSRVDARGRSAGAVYGIDHWTLSSLATLSYGARYARYNYLEGSGLFSPHVSLTLVPIPGWRVEGLVSQRMLAPGAEEFLEPLVSGLWVPPERTFAGVTPLVAERTRHAELSLERDLPAQYVLTFRSFYQVTDNQQFALFGLTPALGAQASRYAVGDGGDVEARGWSIGFSNMMSSRVRGSVAYTLTSARWLPTGAFDVGSLLSGARSRLSRERLQDLSTAIEADIPVVATRVMVAYRVNTGFSVRDGGSVKPGLDSRFDVQIIQPLPFLDFTSARWQVLVAVRNFFRDTASDNSFYDELLVIRPPKRVVTGLLVRF